MKSILEKLGHCSPMNVPYAQSQLIAIPGDKVAFLPHPDLSIKIMALVQRTGRNSYYFPVTAEMYNKHEELEDKVMRYEITPIKTSLGNVQFIITNLESNDEWSLSKLALQNIDHPVSAARVEGGGYSFSRCDVEIEKIYSLDDIHGQLELCFGDAIIDSENSPNLKNILGGLELDNTVADKKGNESSLNEIERTKNSLSVKAKSIPKSQEEGIDLANVDIDELFADDINGIFN